MAVARKHYSILLTFFNVIISLNDQNMCNRWSDYDYYKTERCAHSFCHFGYFLFNEIHTYVMCNVNKIALEINVSNFCCCCCLCRSYR